MYSQTKYLICGENGILVEYGDSISKEINAVIRQTVSALEAARHDFIVEVVPTYRSVLVQYDPLKKSHAEMLEFLKTLQADEGAGKEEKVKLIEIPTLYGRAANAAGNGEAGDDYGPDIAFVASHNQIDVDEVIRIHSGTDYLVYMMGFIPGFTYLGGMDKRIATPRLASPRTRIVGGSVGIAGEQTGIYPSDSPGGWQIIGRTPLNLFDASKEPPVFIEAGNYIRYVPIDEEEFVRIRSLVEKGEYVVVTKTVSKEELHEQR